MRAHLGAIHSAEYAVLVDSRKAVLRAWPRFARGIRLLARRLAADRDDRKDLVQEARIALWKADPTRFDLTDPQDRRYLRRILVRRVWRVWGGDHDRSLAASYRSPESIINEWKETRT